MRELLARIDSRELTAWMAYERVAGPLGPERGDVQAALIASTIANSNRGKNSRAYKPEDFMPKWDDPARWAPVEQTGQDHLSLIRGLNAAMGGRDRTRGGGEGGDAPRPARQSRRRRQGRRSRDEVDRSQD